MGYYIMTEPNYKEFADKFYTLLKENPFYREVPAFNEVVKEYEKLHKPKLKFITYSCIEKFVYDNRDYARIDGFWYRVQKCVVLTLIEDDKLAEELITAYSEWEKTQ